MLLVVSWMSQRNHTHIWCAWHLGCSIPFGNFDIKETWSKLFSLGCYSGISGGPTKMWHCQHCIGWIQHRHSSQIFASNHPASTSPSTPLLVICKAVPLILIGLHQSASHCHWALVICEPLTISALLTHIKCCEYRFLLPRYSKYLFLLHKWFPSLTPQHWFPKIL